MCDLLRTSEYFYNEKIEDIYFVKGNFWKFRSERHSEDQIWKAIFIKHGNTFDFYDESMKQSNFNPNAISESVWQTEPKV